MDSVTDAVLLQALAATRSPVTVADVNLPDVPLVWCNQAFLDLTEYDKHEIIGRNCRFLQGSDTKKSDIETLRKSVKGGTESRVLIKNYTKSGKPFWNDLLMTPIRDDVGNVTHIVGFQNDISSDAVAKNAEQKIEQLARLNDEISEETTHLRDLNDAKDDFISVASHQLRTPATITKQYLGMVLDEFAGDVPKKQRALLEKAADSNERQIDLVDRLLDLARLESGAKKLSKIAINLDDMLADIVASFQPRAEAIEQTITYSPSSKPIIIHADAAILTTVVENIIDNALKYSYRGSHTNVTSEVGDDFVSIIVRDEGIGMDGGSVKRAFERFARIENREVEEIGGSGLGLYWAKKAIEMHRGRIDVESTLGNGSAFFIRLPRE